MYWQIRFFLSIWISCLLKKKLQFFQHPNKNVGTFLFCQEFKRIRENNNFLISQTMTTDACWFTCFVLVAGLTSPGVPGMPGVQWHPQILADQLTLYQPGRADYANFCGNINPKCWLHPVVHFQYQICWRNVNSGSYLSSMYKKKSMVYFYKRLHFQITAMQPAFYYLILLILRVFMFDDFVTS